MTTAAILMLGLVAGIAGGMFGVGGGLIMVPALLFLFQYTELQSFGTSLAAMLPPVGLFGVFEYYRGGHVNVRAAILLAIGIVLGMWLGARIMINVPAPMVKKVYGAFLIVIGIRFLLGIK